MQLIIYIKQKTSCTTSQWFNLNHQAKICFFFTTITWFTRSAGIIILPRNIDLLHFLRFVGNFTLFFQFMFELKNWAAKFNMASFTTFITCWYGRLVLFLGESFVAFKFWINFIFVFQKLRESFYHHIQSLIVRVPIILISHGFSFVCFAFVGRF